VAGKVTYKGAPVTGGTIAFAAADGSNPGSSAPIRPDGSYVVTDLPAGEMIVTVETETVNPSHKQSANPGAGKGGAGRHASMSPPPAGAGGGGKAPVYVKVPPKYADPKKTPLRATLSRGSNTYHAELTD
jgi:hypothetical protein